MGEISGGGNAEDFHTTPGYNGIGTPQVQERERVESPATVPETPSNEGGDGWLLTTFGPAAAWVYDKAVELGNAVSPDKPPKQDPVKYTDGETSAGVLPLNVADFQRVAARIDFNRTPVEHDPVPADDPSGVDFNPNRTIVLIDGDLPSGPPSRLLKIFLTVPNPDDPTVRNTNFGPNAGIEGTVKPDSIWPNHDDERPQ
jgi:hypothetical protein